MKRRSLAVALPILVGLPVIAAFAGGWATITVEHLPDYLVAGEPTNITFSIRQHGIELMRAAQPAIEARSGDVEYKARAVATNRPGYYTAKLEVPTTGRWTVTIKSGHGRSDVTLLPIAAVNKGARPAMALPERERGERLFVAKGCLSCHVHERVKNSGMVDVGPNLSDARYASEYLAQFLADPRVKTNWSGNNRMPDLNLNEREITALIAFLNASQSQRQAVKSQ